MRLFNKAKESKSFEYLDKLVHSKAKMINLDCDITLDNSFFSKEKSEYREGIRLDVSNIIIDGRGHSIDAKGKARIFFVTGRNIILKNIVFKNGFVDDDNGGAIHNTGELTISQSSFAYNRSNHNGGAISNNGSMNIITSKFEENTSGWGGGAIFSWSTLTISKSSFANNTANHGGGAIENYDYELRISESEFKSNTSKNNGGTIYNYKGTLIISQSSFTGNISHLDGGSIYTKGGNLSISQSSLAKNISYHDGGSVYINDASSSISESRFEENEAKCDGGAIHNGEGNLIISKSTFESNASKGNGGGINNSQGELDISQSSFNDNTCKEYCHDIYNDGVLSLENFYSNNPSKSILNNHNCHLIGENDEIIKKIHNLGKIFTANHTCNDEKNFSYLAQLIQENHTIILDCDIKLDWQDREEMTYPDGIPLDWNGIVIDGNGHSIDAQGKTRIFKCSGKNITIRNLTLKNGFTNDYGGAIYNNNSEITIENCIFELNNATCGGAIYNFRKIEKISVKRWKSLVMQITNDIPFNHIGSISCDGCTFLNNSADSASAIWSNNIVKLNNSEFLISDETASNAICIDGDEESLLYIENSTFSTPLNGELIHINEGFGQIKKSKFMTSKSQNHNYLIYNENGTLELEDNKFEDMDHQIIYNNSHLAIKRKDKIKNLIDEGLKSHIFHFKETITITPKSFTCLDKMIGDSNVVTLTDDIELIYSEQIFYEGGIELSKDNLIIDGKGHSINANNLSRIFLITAKDIVLKNIVFKNGKYFRNSLDDKFQGGGSIHIIKGASVKIENCEFENNYSRVSAGAILNKGNLWIHDSVFKSNSSEFQTGAILNKGKIEAKDSIFINNNAYYYAGAIHNHTDSILNMADCKFCENKVEYYAGAINNLGKISLDNCIFESNRTTNYNGGGAICNWQDLLIKKSVFKNNESKNYGGAIFNRNKLKCDECSFIGNYGRSSSGAIHVDRGELSVTNSRFEKNHSSFGGALRIVYGNATFEKCEFSRNYIDEFTFGGGGSAFDSLHSTIVCSICDFDDNKSPYRGGAAQFAKSDAQINNCSFTNNVAPRAGGGIYLRACKSEVMFCTFSGNHSNVGAAIYDTIGNTKIVSCIFTDNIADSQDSGAIEHSSNDFEIDNCIFENNIPKDKSTDGGLW